MLVVQTHNKMIQGEQTCVSNNNGELTLLVVVLSREQKVSITDFRRYLVNSFFALEYGPVNDTFLDILDAIKVITFFVV